MSRRFLLFLLACASAFADCGPFEFRGFGAGASESEALAAARASLAPQVHSSIKVSSQHTQTQRVSGGREDLSSRYTSKIEEESTLPNAHSARILSLERADGGYKAIVCLSRSDAAKGFASLLKPVADSLVFSASAVLGSNHPKRKGEAWQKTQPLWSEFARLQPIIESLDKEQAVPFAGAGTLYAQAREAYLSYCQTAKLHWSPETEDVYSGLAFFKLSKNLKLEKSSCKGGGIALSYKNTGHKCEYAGIFKCSHRPSLLLSSCDGEEYRFLESPNIDSFQKREEVALERLHEKLGDGIFWDEWEMEIKEWRPQCE